MTTWGHQPRRWPALLAIALLVAACAGPGPTPSPPATAAPVSPTTAPTITPTPTASPSAAASSTPTPAEWTELATFRGEMVRVLVAGGPGLIAAGCRVSTKVSYECAKALIRTSPDGSTWTEATVGDAAGGNIESIQKVGDTYVALGTRYLGGMDLRGAVWTSRDGTRWAPVAMFPGRVANAIVERDGRLLGVGTRSTYASEPNGLIVWELDGVGAWGDGRVIETPGNHLVRGVTVTSSGYLAWGVNDPTYPIVPAVIANSTDGLRWRFVPEQPSLAGAVILSVVERDGGFLAVGQVIGSGAFTPAVWHSADALNWGRIEDPGGPIRGQPVRAIVFGRPSPASRVRLRRRGKPHHLVGVARRRPLDDARSRLGPPGSRRGRGVRPGCRCRPAARRRKLRCNGRGPVRDLRAAWRPGAGDPGPHDPRLGRARRSSDTNTHPGCRLAHRRPGRGHDDGHGRGLGPGWTASTLDLDDGARVRRGRLARGRRGVRHRVDLRDSARAMRPDRMWARRVGHDERFGQGCRSGSSRDRRHGPCRGRARRCTPSGGLSRGFQSAVGCERRAVGAGQHHGLCTWPSAHPGHDRTGVHLLTRLPDARPRLPDGRRDGQVGAAAAMEELAMERPGSRWELPGAADVRPGRNHAGRGRMHWRRSTCALIAWTALCVVWMLYSAWLAVKVNSESSIPADRCDLISCGFYVVVTMVIVFSVWLTIALPLALYWYPRRNRGAGEEPPPDAPGDRPRPRARRWIPRLVTGSRTSSATTDRAPKPRAAVRSSSRSACAAESWLGPNMAQDRYRGSPTGPPPRRALTSHRDTFQTTNGAARSAITRRRTRREDSPLRRRPSPGFPSQSIVRPVASGGLSRSGLGGRERVRFLRIWPR